MPYPTAVTQTLHLLYDDLIWLASRPHVGPRRARAWYSQVFSVALAPKVRQFTGRVSREALRVPVGALCLEHYNRLSFRLSRLLEDHVGRQAHEPAVFIALIQDCEQVNITTDKENHDVQAAKGDYAAAGIELIDWSEVTPETQEILWRKKLSGKVANAADYRPGPHTPA